MSKNASNAEKPEVSTDDWNRTDVLENTWSFWKQPGSPIRITFYHECAHWYVVKWNPKTNEHMVNESFRSEEQARRTLTQLLTE